LSISSVFNPREVATMAAVLDRRRPDPQQGVFETLLVLAGRPVELEAHLVRLEASLAELFPDRAAPPSLAALELPAGTRAVRVTVAPASDGTLEATVEHRAVTELFATENGGKTTTRAVSLRRLTVTGGLGRHKWRDRALLEEAQARHGDLPLIVDADGAVLEAGRANVFAVRKGALFTPPLDGRILPGVTRARVLEIAAGLGVEAHERTLGHDALLTADEVFLTGSVRGVEPVDSIDGESIAARGEVAPTLAAELRRLWLGAPVA
jgi:para-aminobenzoate synthetase / 4-amino-4-deoxychorismate lyase